MFRESHLEEYPDQIRQVLSPSNPRFVYIHGAIGIGKTHLAVAVMRDWIARGIADRPLYDGSRYVQPDALFVLIAELLMSIQSTFGRDPQGEGEIIAKYSQTALVILDDLGAENSSDWSMSRLYVIANHRFDECKPTIITSNMSPSALKEWEPRIASRALSGIVLELRGEDRRRKP